MCLSLECWDFKGVHHHCPAPFKKILSNQNVPCMPLIPILGKQKRWISVELKARLVYRVSFRTVEAVFLCSTVLKTQKVAPECRLWDKSQLFNMLLPTPYTKPNQKQQTRIDPGTKLGILKLKVITDSSPKKKWGNTVNSGWTKCCIIIILQEWEENKNPTGF